MEVLFSELAKETMSFHRGAFVPLTQDISSQAIQRCLREAHTNNHLDY